LSAQKQINVGKVSGVFGIKGWIKVFSFTEPRENILSYSPWILKKGSSSKIVKIIDGKLQGRAVVAQLDGVIDRDQAADLTGWDVLIMQSQLPATEVGEYYWSDLIGLNVENLQGIRLGVVDSLLETGANDVLIIKGDRELAIPFLQGHTVFEIDLDQGRMLVDWDAEF
jgi:16S rRNA processing protein RimM